MKLIKRAVTPLVNEKTKEHNLTKSDISSVCNNFDNEKMENEMQSEILSFLFLAINGQVGPRIGTGDIVSSKFRTGLTDERSSDYIDTHSRFTKIFNDLVNGSLPGSIFMIPKFFATPMNECNEKVQNAYKKYFPIKSWLILTNISDLVSIRNYYFLWYAFNKNKSFILHCFHAKNNCSNPIELTFIDDAQDELSIIGNILHLRKYPENGILIEANVTKPPCTDEQF